MSTNSATNVSTPTMSASRPHTAKIASQRLCVAISGRIWATSAAAAISVGLAERLAQHMAADIAGERKQHQRQAGSKDGLVADRAVRQVAERDLHDVGGDRRRRLERVEGEIGLHAGGHR